MRCHVSVSRLTKQSFPMVAKCIMAPSTLAVTDALLHRLEARLPVAEAMQALMLAEGEGEGRWAQPSRGNPPCALLTVKYRVLTSTLPEIHP